MFTCVRKDDKMHGGVVLNQLGVSTDLFRFTFLLIFARSNRLEMETKAEPNQFGLVWFGSSPFLIKIV